MRVSGVTSSWGSAAPLHTGHRLHPFSCSVGSWSTLTIPAQLHISKRRRECLQCPRIAPARPNRRCVDARAVPEDKGQPNTPSASQGDALGAFLRAAEVLCLVSAGGLQAYSLWAAAQQTAAETSVAARGKTTTKVVQVTAEPPLIPGQMITTGTAVSVVLALLVNLLIRWRDASRTHGSDGRLTSSGAARLARLEVLASQQASALQAVEKQLEKLQIRVRLRNKDLQPQLAKFHGESAQQAAVLVKVAQKVEELGTDVQDTQLLLSQLQDVVQKQFQLVVQAIKIARGMEFPPDPADPDTKGGGTPEAGDGGGGTPEASPGLGGGSGRPEPPTRARAQPGRHKLRLLSGVPPGAIAGWVRAAAARGGPDVRLAGAAAYVAQRTAALRGGPAALPPGAAVSTDGSPPPHVVAGPQPPARSPDSTIGRAAPLIDARRTLRQGNGADGGQDPIPVATAEAGRMVRAAADVVEAHLDGLAESVATRAAGRGGATSPPRPPSAGAVGTPQQLGLTARQADGLSPLLMARAATRTQSAGSPVVPTAVAQRYGTPSAVVGPSGDRPDLHPGLPSLLVARKKLRQQISDADPQALAHVDAIEARVAAAAQTLAQSDAVRGMLSQLTHGIGPEGTHLPSLVSLRQAVRRGVRESDPVLAATVSRAVKEVTALLTSSDPAVTAAIRAGLSSAQQRLCSDPAAAETLAQLRELAKAVIGDQKMAALNMEMQSGFEPATRTQVGDGVAGGMKGIPALLGAAAAVQDRVLAGDPDVTAALGQGVTAAKAAILERNPELAQKLDQGLATIYEQLKRADPTTAAALDDFLVAVRKSAVGGAPAATRTVSELFSAVKAQVLALDPGRAQALKVGLDGLRSRILSGDPEVVRALAARLGPLRERVAAGDTRAVLDALHALQAAAAGKLPDNVKEAAQHVASRLASHHNLTADDTTLIAMALRKAIATVPQEAVAAADMPALAQSAASALRGLSPVLSGRLAVRKDPVVAPPTRPRTLQPAGATPEALPTAAPPLDAQTRYVSARRDAVGGMTTSSSTTARPWAPLALPQIVGALPRASLPPGGAGVRSRLSGLAGSLDQRLVARRAGGSGPPSDDGGIPPTPPGPGPPPGGSPPGASSGPSASGADWIDVRAASRRSSGVAPDTGSSGGQNASFLDTTHAADCPGLVTRRKVGPAYPSARAAPSPPMPLEAYYDTRFASPAIAAKLGLPPTPDDGPRRPEIPPNARGPSPVVVTRAGAGAVLLAGAALPSAAAPSMFLVPVPPVVRPQGKPGFTVDVRDVRPATLPPPSDLQGAKSLGTSPSSVGKSYTVGWGLRAAGPPSAGPAGDTPKGRKTAASVSTPGPDAPPPPPDSRGAKSLGIRPSSVGKSYALGWGLRAVVPTSAGPAGDVPKGAKSMSLTSTRGPNAPPPPPDPQGAKSMSLTESPSGKSYAAGWGPVPALATTTAQAESSPPPDRQGAKGMSLTPSPSGKSYTAGWGLAPSLATAIAQASIRARSPPEDPQGAKSMSLTLSPSGKSYAAGWGGMPTGALTTARARTQGGPPAGLRRRNSVTTTPSPRGKAYTAGWVAGPQAPSPVLVAKPNAERAAAVADPVTSEGDGVMGKASAVGGGGREAAMAVMGAPGVSTRAPGAVGGAVDVPKVSVPAGVDVDVAATAVVRGTVDVPTVSVPAGVDVDVAAMAVGAPAAETAAQGEEEGLHLGNGRDGKQEAPGGGKGTGQALVVQEAEEDVVCNVVPQSDGTIMFKF